MAREAKVARDADNVPAVDATVPDALRMAIEGSARRVLDGYSDEELLGRRQARHIVVVGRAVREELGRTVPALLASLSPWYRNRLVRETVTREVRKAQGGALGRRWDAEDGPTTDAPLEITGPINGVTIVAVRPLAVDEVEQPPSWSAGR